MKRFIKVVAAKVRQFERTLNDYLNKTQGSAQIPYLAYVNWGLALTDLDKALEKLETSAIMQPNSPIVQMNLGKIYLRKDMYSDALEKFKKTIRLDNFCGEAYSLTAACLVLQNDLKEAETYYKKACSISPENSEVHTNYATALARIGKKFKALETYKQALKVNKDDFFALHCSGVILSNLGRYNDALEMLKAALKVQPENPDTLLYIAICLYYTNLYDEAFENIEKSLSIRKNYHDGMMIKGVCLAKLGKEAECISCFAANEKENESNYLYYTYWGIALQTFERYAEAKEKFLQAFELNRDDEFTIFSLAENYVKEGNLTPALNLFEKLTYNNNKNAKAFERLGDVYYQKNNFKEAISAYLNTLKNSRKQYHIYYKIAKSYFYLDDLKNSELYYCKAIEYSPDLIEAYTGYANLLIQVGNMKEALRKIRAAYKKAPDSFEVLSIYSRILIKLEMYADAIDKIDKIIKIEPEYYEAVFTKAETLNSMNKPQEAIGLLQSMPQEYHDTKDFLFISMNSYKRLAELLPSHYNISKAIEYCDRLTDKYSSEYKLNDIKNKLEEILSKIEGK